MHAIQDCTLLVVDIELVARLEVVEDTLVVVEIDHMLEVQVVHSSWEIEDNVGHAIVVVVLMMVMS